MTTAMEEKKPRVKILVACHKADPNIRQDDIYMPIQVGKALHPELDLGFQCDNTGDNISEKNGSYCELTALYWAWKNLKDVDYIGLCHYRRYFDMDDNPENILSILRKHDAIILKKRGLCTNIMTELAYLTSIEDTYILIDELLKIYPDKKQLIYKYFYCTNRFTNCNMFIMSKFSFDEYCLFLFGLLGSVEKKIHINGYSRLRRVLGYLSEPLLGFWIGLNNLKVKEVEKDQSTELGSSYSRFGRKFDLLRYDIAFLIKKLSLKNNRPHFFEDWVTAGLRQDGIQLSNI